MRSTDHLGGWFILRTRPSFTMKLAQSLADDGFEVWTPIETRKIRIPRMNARREVRLPLMPSYVFAKGHQLLDLIELAGKRFKPRRKPTKEQPAHSDFSVMRATSGIPFVPDEEFAYLRALEARLTPKRKAERSFTKGAEVRVEGGSFGGMSGIVERSNKGQTVICFNDRYLVKIDTCLLSEDMLGASVSSGEPAAEAA